MIDLKLPFWLGGTELSKLKVAAQRWWETTSGWLMWPYSQLDPDTCHLNILELWAWQRDVTRFNGEPEALFRLRVKYAFVNAVDAGSTAGMQRILQRLGVGYIEIEERQVGRDWDVVLLRLSDNQLSINADLMRVLVQQYGRTCRRYDFENITAMTVQVAIADFNDDQATLVASL
ncbi:phage tail protein [Pseudomonas asplenii]|uniref:Phage tail protein (Tail_P2_I) n=1 Tax=Pseudomonas asplenii TaxID=53407 RepID=A0A1H6MDF3_9PSED|nr:phage tail protein [Pseudomonas fuscovaginae]SEH99522.1 Phage tail protein (Tail_P2_I) [Pseudomonas fuscovaginae]